jgi:hypothetical protein
MSYIIQLMALFRLPEGFFILSLTLFHREGFSYPRDDSFHPAQDYPDLVQASFHPVKDYLSRTENCAHRVEISPHLTVPVQEFTSLIATYFNALFHYDDGALLL